ncbi:biotin--[acetyl-CoA-carboxylase] ligase [uncultured Porphyromonas sp.]|uniref:biotin--[acetyl-CoA-carboxylase] ligase n=1 Tax=uncultured Porphyromonas sp. TaxID=159274 RepID=UPI0026072531|nr:biotin--[acetyl-CoA-carboxylase] ligase [uncultured Porphyromonas sp.]
MRQIHLAQVDSTNSYLRRRLAEEPDLEEYTVITATDQTAGRGQPGHRWEATAGQNLTMTLLLHPGDLMEDGGTLFDLNILTALAVRQALLRELPPGAEVKVKWPNDLLVGGRKICGILIENTFSSSRLDASVVGIGVNVLQEHFGEGYPTPPTSIAIEQRRLGVTPLTGDGWHDRLVYEILEALEEWRSRPVSRLRAEYHRSLFGRGEVARFARPSGETFYGMIEGVRPDGRILIRELPTGRRSLYAFREVSMVLTASLNLGL